MCFYFQQRSKNKIYQQIPQTRYFKTAVPPLPGSPARRWLLVHQLIPHGAFALDDAGATKKG